MTIALESGKDIGSEYQKLSPIDHILKRNGMYIGSIDNIQSDTYVFDEATGTMVKREITYNPGLLKLLDEVISNSVDVHLKSKGVDTIKVNVSRLTGEISVEDNGGIPVVIHPSEKIYVPELIFGHLHAGSNFEDDERHGAGMNGLGAKLANVFSTAFSVYTNDKTSTFIQGYSNNMKTMSVADVKQDKRARGQTIITFTPDYQRLGCVLDEGNILRIQKRVYDVAGCNPDIKVYWNDTLIKIKNFDEYCRMYLDPQIDLVVDQTDSWHVCVAPSDNDTFEHTSFVNGVDTFNGGTHINYVVENIIYKVRDFILKKYKLEIKPNNIKQQMRLFIKCKINAPTFPSQTKDYLSTQPSNYGFPWSPSEKFMTKLLSSGVVQNVLDWAEGEQRKADLAELKKINAAMSKTNYLKKILKFDDATTKNRSQACLFLTEGDSASRPILSARNSQTQGVFPLKGKMLNVRDVKISKIITNEEIHNLCAIIGLQLGKEANVADLRFGKICITPDADIDGLHVTGLFLNFINEFWPNLIKEGLIYRLLTPIVVVSKGKQEIEFLTEKEYLAWVDQNDTRGWKFMYQKGLGGWSTKEFERFLHDEKYHQKFTADDVRDIQGLDLAFDKKRANDRKVWLSV